MQSSCALTRNLLLSHQPLPYRLVNVTLKFFLLLVGHLLRTIPVVLIDPTISITFSCFFTLLLLFQYVEHLLAVHTPKPLINQAHHLAFVLTFLVDGHLDHGMFGITVSEHEVNNVVTSLIRQRMIFVVHLVVRGHVPKHLMPCFMRHHKSQFLLRQFRYELTPVFLISSVGTRSRYVIHYASTPNH